MYADENILYFKEDFGNVVFDCTEMDILNIDLNCIDIDVNNFDEDDPDTIIHVRLLVWHTKVKKHQAHKKELNEKKKVGLLHVRRWEKINRSNVYWRVVKFVSVVYKMGVLKHFSSRGIETYISSSL